jgi:hypothetical protein
MNTGVIDRFTEVFTRYIDSGFGLLGGEVAFPARSPPATPCGGSLATPVAGRVTVTPPLELTTTTGFPSAPLR